MCYFLSGFLLDWLLENWLELLWVNDPIDAFFLHIQGSGRVVLRDGQSIRVGYDGQNGHSYKSIGMELVRRGVLMRKDVTMQSIRDWLEANPEQRSDIFKTNESFIFFLNIISILKYFYN